MLHSQSWVVIVHVFCADAVKEAVRTLQLQLAAKTDEAERVREEADAVKRENGNLKVSLNTDTLLSASYAIPINISRTIMKHVEECFTYLQTLPLNLSLPATQQPSCR